VHWDMGMMHGSPKRVRLYAWVVAVALLLATFGLAVTSARVKSATLDEDAYIGKGTAIWMEGNYWLRTAHPPLGPMLSTLPLLTEPDLSPPTDHRCWPDGSARSCGRLMLFYYLSDTQRTLLLARLPTMLLMLLLATLAYRWAADLFGRSAGLVALALCALDPNVLAHARLVTLDLSTALFVFLSCFAFWRFWVRPIWGRLALLGLALGAAGAIHFASGLLVPLFVLLSLVRVWRSMQVGKFPALEASSRWRRLVVALALLLAAGCIAALVIWVVHGADFGPVPLWNGIWLPAPVYFNELAERMQGRLSAPHSFLLGRHYEGGRWPYFIVAFLVKTPWPTILLFAIAVASLIRWRDGRFGDAVLLITAGVYFALALFSDFNRGYRYILPVLPFLFVFAGRAGQVVRRAPRPWLRYVPMALLGWLVIANLAIYPHYLAYFNELIGPRNGYRVLVDSNVDWGQDLPALERHVAEHDVSSLYLSWFGEPRPWQYDIPYRSIPSKPDELSDIHTRVYHPDYPPPGTYAISATNLQALLFNDKDLFAWFLRREPVAQPGYSIMIYEVPRLLDTEAPPVAVALGGKQIDQVPPAAFEDFWHTNDLRLRWFDDKTSCILPAEADVWYVLGAKAESVPPPCPLWEVAESVTRLPKRGGEGELGLYRLQVGPAVHEAWLTELAAGSPLIISDEVTFAPGEAPDLRREVNPALRFGDRLDMVGYRVLSDAFHPGSEWQMVSYWQVVTAEGEQLKLFVQLLDDAGNTHAKYDGLDIPVIGWPAGDLLAQRHTLPLPDDLAPCRYWVQVGAYNTETGKRLRVLVNGTAVGTRLLLLPMEVR
jgi:4-amino-4-deoxy-L-arabinose transferase-like glycosyltransferase